MSEAVHLNRRQFLRGVAVVGVSSAAGLLMTGCTSPPPRARTPRIGVLSAASNPAVLDPFRQGLRDLGYVPGENITIEYRYVRGPGGQINEDVAPVLAAELVALNVDVIVTGGLTNALAAKNATTTIPIVAWNTGADPVGVGLVASLAHPGGNVTGFTYAAQASSGKRLELLKQAIPAARRVGGLGLSPDFTDAVVGWWRLSKDAAQVLGIELVPVLTTGADDLERAFDAARVDGVDALVTAPDATIFTNGARIAELAAQKHLPVVFDDRAYVDVGGLMSYGPNFVDSWHRAAGYVDRILKGAKPGDLPVEHPSKFDLVINLRAAAALGLTIPPSVLAQATEVLR